MIWTSTSDILCCQFYFILFLTRKKEFKKANTLYLWGAMNHHVRYLQDGKFGLSVSLNGFWLASQLDWKDLSYDSFLFLVWWIQLTPILEKKKRNWYVICEGNTWTFMIYTYPWKGEWRKLDLLWNTWSHGQSLQFL